MSYVVSTASKSPFAKPKKHSQWESFPPVAQLLFPFDNSLYFVMVKYIQLACEQALWRALFLSPTPRAPRRASGIPDSFTWIQGAVPPLPRPRVPQRASRIPDSFSWIPRVLSPAPRAPRRASGIPNFFSWIPGAVPRPQRILLAD